MGFHTKRFTEDEQKAFKLEHELAEPKEWAVMDGGIVYAFYDTEAEATEVLTKLQEVEAITNRFEDWVAETADNLNVSELTIQETIKNYL